MNVRSITLTAAVILLSSCMEVDEYRSALVGSWSGGVEGKSWCMSLNADDSVFMVNEEKQANGGIEITEFNGIWEVSEGGRFKLRVQRNIRAAVDSDLEPSAKDTNNFFGTEDKDTLADTTTASLDQVGGITSQAIADELRDITAGKLPEQESARASIRYIVQSISEKQMVYRQHMMGGHYSDEFHVERVDNCTI